MMFTSTPFRIAEVFPRSCEVAVTLFPQLKSGIDSYDVTDEQTGREIALACSENGTLESSTWVVLEPVSE